MKSRTQQKTPLCFSISSGEVEKSITLPWRLTSDGNLRHVGIKKILFLVPGVSSGMYTYNENVILSNQSNR